MDPRACVVCTNPLNYGDDVIEVKRVLGFLAAMVLVDDDPFDLKRYKHVRC